MLLVAQDSDAETGMVAGEVAALGGQVARVDTAEFPAGLRLAAEPGPRWRGHLAGRGGEVAWESVSAVYYRRPGKFVFPDGMSGPERRFAMAEAVGGLGGLIASLPCLFVNHPGRAADAEYKPLQLQTARRCGLRVPRTLLTNDGQAARRFIEQAAGPVVYKPLSAAIFAEQDQVKAIYTSLVGSGDIDERQVGLTAHLFQEFIADKAFDARITVVGGKVFAAAVHAGSDAERIDWRRGGYGTLRYETVDAPGGIRAAVVGYLRRLGLAMGAFDFTVDRRGRWWFLECNPQGRGVHRGGHRRPGQPRHRPPAPARGTMTGAIGVSGWQSRARALADALEREGFLRSPRWRAAVEQVPRHVFVPRYYDISGDGGWAVVDGAEPAARDRWLAAVYSDDTLVTQLGSAPIPEDIGGGVVKLHVTGEGAAHGRFLGYPGWFMWLRPDPGSPLRAHETPFWPSTNAAHITVTPTLTPASSTTPASRSLPSCTCHAFGYPRRPGPATGTYWSAPAATAPGRKPPPAASPSATRSATPAPRPMEPGRTGTPALAESRPADRQPVRPHRHLAPSVRLARRAGDQPRVGPPAIADSTELAIGIGRDSSQPPALMTATSFDGHGALPTPSADHVAGGVHPHGLIASGGDGQAETLDGRGAQPHPPGECRLRFLPQAALAPFQDLECGRAGPVPARRLRPVPLGGVVEEGAVAVLVGVVDDLCPGWQEQAQDRPGGVLQLVRVEQGLGAPRVAGVPWLPGGRGGPLAAQRHVGAVPGQPSCR